MSSSVPPENEPTRVTPPAAGGPGAPGAADEDGRRFGAGVLAAVAVAVLVIAGVGGYLIGHSSGDDEGTKSGEKSGQQAGFQEGLERGRAEVTAAYARGQPAYKEIFDAGKAKGFREGVKQGTAQGERTGEAQGERTGFEQGQRVGVTTGESEGVRQGAAAVLGGFGTWTDGAFYIVTVGASSTAGVPYTITSRSQIQPDTSYKLCDSGGSQICQSASTAAGSGSGGPDANTAEDDGGAGDPNQ